MNWLVSEPPLDAQPAEGMWEEVQDTISYWATRLQPLMGSNVVFAGCNRIGTEKDITFTGSSCIMLLGKHPVVIDYAGKSEEKLLVTEIAIKR